MKLLSRGRVSIEIVAVFSVSFLFYFLRWTVILEFTTKSLVFVNAVRSLHGDLIHKDYYSPYGPGAYGILALLFKLNSHWFVVERCYGIAAMAGIVAATYGLLAGQVNRLKALAGSAVSGSLVDVVCLLSLSELPCILLSLIGSALLMRALQSGNFRFTLRRRGLCGSDSAVSLFPASSCWSRTSWRSVRITPSAAFARDVESGSFSPPYPMGSEPALHSPLFAVAYLASAPIRVS